MGGNLADRFEAVAADRPHAEAVVVDGRRLTYAELDERADRLATVLAGRGIGPDDRVGVLLGNGHEHLEVLLACFKLRALAVNLNTRSAPVELAALIGLSRARLVVHEADLGGVLPPTVAGLARGAGYEAALAAAEPTRVPAAGRSGDDRYVLFTGGTTGRPKGVLWRHADLYPAALAGHLDLGPRRVLVAAPFFHGTGQWLALATLLAGGTVVTTGSRTFDPSAVWSLAATEAASYLVVVGDAFAHPLAEALEADPHRWPLDRLTVLLSGGARLSPDVTARLLDVLPCLMVVDGYGASETGGQARFVTVAGSPPGPVAFRIDDDTAVLDDELRVLPPGDPGEGWLARRGPIPLGYDGDPQSTTATFPVVDGVRWAVPGDRARWAGTDRIEILGRGSLSINTGGEKVHAEEVEARLRTHDSVADAVVVGTPDERWGEVVTAIVAPAPGRRPTLADLAAHCRMALAPFKVPRRLVLVGAVRRTPSGKPDYRWARDQARR